MDYVVSECSQLWHWIRASKIKLFVLMWFPFDAAVASQVGPLAQALFLGDQSMFNTTRDDCIWKRGNDRDQCPDKDITMTLYTSRRTKSKVNESTTMYRNISEIVVVSVRLLNAMNERLRGKRKRKDLCNQRTFNTIFFIEKQNHEIFAAVLQLFNEFFFFFFSVCARAHVSVSVCVV